MLQAKFYDENGNEIEELDLTAVDEKLERTKAVVTLAIVAAVNIANVCGFAFDAGPLLNVVGCIFSAVSIYWAWWKNQNVTSEAAQAQVLLDSLKGETKRAKHAAEPYDEAE